MATRSGIDTAITSRLTDDHQIMGVAVKAEFDTSDIRVWSGIGDATIASETYTGAGTLLGISGNEDTAELSSTGTIVTLSGMDETVLSYALNENYQNRLITIFLVFLMGGSNEVAGTMTMFKGRMTALSINDDTQGATITINAENRLVDLNRPSHLRYTLESQKHILSSDTSFKFVQQIQDMDIIWGKSSQKENVPRNNRGRDGIEKDNAIRA